MTIQFATTNKGKFESVQQLFQSYSISVTQACLDIPEIQAKSVKEIAEQKVLRAFEFTQNPCMAQDSGFYIHAWKGFPGPYVKDTLETLGIEGILKIREASNPRCEFREAHAYCDQETSVVFVAKIAGTLSETPRGEQQTAAWSDLWRIFQPDGWHKTIAEMTEVERSEWSAVRGQTAAARCARWLANQR